jgi:hypothetical protein
VQKRGRSPAQAVKGQWLDVSPCCSTYPCAFVVPLLPQACRSEEVRKLVAEVAGSVVALAAARKIGFAILPVWLDLAPKIFGHMLLSVAEVAIDSLHLLLAQKPCRLSSVSHWRSWPQPIKTRYTR